jgi:hypothetical protein
MVDDSTQHRIEHVLHIGAVLGALLSIPAVVLQASENHELHQVGNWMNVAIWLYFVAEVTILLRFAPDNLEWIRHHKLEFFVVLATAPLFTQMGERGMVFGFAPLLIIPRMMQLLKFAKFAKIGKLLKSLKIIKNDESWPEWLDSVVWFAVVVLVAGLVGTLVDKEAHSLIHGLLYWREQLSEISGIESPFVLGTIGVVAVALFAVAVKGSPTVDRKQGQS